MHRLLVKSKSKRSLAHWLVFVSCYACLCSCNNAALPTQEETAGRTGEISVSIRLSKIAAANISRAEVVVTGAGMDDIRQGLTVSGTTITGTVRGIPAGASRLFTLNGYDASGNLTYTGSATATINTGQQVEVHIVMGASTSALKISAVASYTYADTTPTTGTISNFGTSDATDVVIRFRARNSAGEVIVEATASIGTVRTGESKVFKVTFGSTSVGAGVRHVASVDYTISYSEGNPIAGTVIL